MILIRSLRLGDVRELLAEYVPRQSIDLDAEAWPDLDSDEPGGRFLQWLADPGRSPFRPAFVGEVRALSGASEARRREVLGALLAAVGQLLREGRPSMALGPLRAALELAPHVPDLPHEPELRAQLLLLLARLEFWLPDELSLIHI